MVGEGDNYYLKIKKWVPHDWYTYSIKENHQSH